MTVLMATQKKDIEIYVASFPVCASAKQLPRRPPGRLQTMASPSAPWKEISMEFIVELPRVLEIP